MKLALVGSAPLVDKPEVRSLLEAELERLKPVVVLLSPNKKFNEFIKVLALKRGIYVNEMHPPKPTWLGPAKQSLRKEKCRELQAHFLTSQADYIICIEKIGAPGKNYRRVVEMAKMKGLRVLEIGF